MGRTLLHSWSHMGMRGLLRVPPPCPALLTWSGRGAARCGGGFSTATTPLRDQSGQGGGGSGGGQGAPPPPPASTADPAPRSHRFRRHARRVLLLCVGGSALHLWLGLYQEEEKGEVEAGEAVWNGWTGNVHALGGYGHALASAVQRSRLRLLALQQEGANRAAGEGREGGGSLPLLLPLGPPPYLFTDEAAAQEYVGSGCPPWARAARDVSSLSRRRRGREAGEGEEGGVDGQAADASVLASLGISDAQLRASLQPGGRMRYFSFFFAGRRRVDVAVFRGVNEYTGRQVEPGTPRCPVVINASSIAAARPLAVELCVKHGCTVVAYTHAGLTLPTVCTPGDGGAVRVQKELGGVTGPYKPPLAPGQLASDGPPGHGGGGSHALLQGMERELVATLGRIGRGEAPGAVLASPDAQAAAAVTGISPHAPVQGNTQDAGGGGKHWLRRAADRAVRLGAAFALFTRTTGDGAPSHSAALMPGKDFGLRWVRGGGGGEEEGQGDEGVPLPSPTHPAAGAAWGVAASKTRGGSAGRKAAWSVDDDAEEEGVGDAVVEVALPTPELEAAELAAVLRHIGASRAVLVSTGANWAGTALAASKNADHVAGLVLIDPLLPSASGKVWAPGLQHNVEEVVGVRGEGRTPALAARLLRVMESTGAALKAEEQRSGSEGVEAGGLPSSPPTPPATLFHPSSSPSAPYFQHSLVGHWPALVGPSLPLTEWLAPSQVGLTYSRLPGVLGRAGGQGSGTTTTGGQEGRGGKGGSPMDAPTWGASSLATLLTGPGKGGIVGDATPRTLQAALQASGAGSALLFTGATRTLSHPSTLAVADGEALALSAYAQSAALGASLGHTGTLPSWSLVNAGRPPLSLPLLLRGSIDVAGADAYSHTVLGRLVAGVMGGGGGGGGSTTHAEGERGGGKGGNLPPPPPSPASLAPLTYVWRNTAETAALLSPVLDLSRAMASVLLSRGSGTGPAQASVSRTHPGHPATGCGLILYPSPPTSAAVREEALQVSLDLGQGVSSGQALANASLHEYEAGRKRGVGLVCGATYEPPPDSDTRGEYTRAQVEGLRVRAWVEELTLQAASAWRERVEAQGEGWRDLDAGTFAEVALLPALEEVANVRLVPRGVGGRVNGRSTAPFLPIPAASADPGEQLWTAAYLLAIAQAHGGAVPGKAGPGIAGSSTPDSPSSTPPTPSLPPGGLAGLPDTDSHSRSEALSLVRKVLTRSAAEVRQGVGWTGRGGGGAAHVERAVQADARALEDALVALIQQRTAVGGVPPPPSPPHDKGGGRRGSVESAARLYSTRATLLSSPAMSSLLPHSWAVPLCRLSTVSRYIADASPALLMVAGGGGGGAGSPPPGRGTKGGGGGAPPPSSPSPIAALSTAVAQALVASVEAEAARAESNLHDVMSDWADPKLRQAVHDFTRKVGGVVPGGAAGSSAPDRSSSRGGLGEASDPLIALVDRSSTARALAEAAFARSRATIVVNNSLSLGYARLIDSVLGGAEGVGAWKAALGGHETDEEVGKGAAPPRSDLVWHAEAAHSNPRTWWEFLSGGDAPSPPPSPLHDSPFTDSTHAAVSRQRRANQARLPFTDTPDLALPYPVAVLLPCPGGSDVQVSHGVSAPSPPPLAETTVSLGPLSATLVTSRGVGSGEGGGAGPHDGPILWGTPSFSLGVDVVASEAEGWLGGRTQWVAPNVHGMVPSLFLPHTHLPTYFSLWEETWEALGVGEETQEGLRAALADVLAASSSGRGGVDMALSGLSPPLARRLADLLLHVPAHASLPSLLATSLGFHQGGTVMTWSRALSTGRYPAPPPLPQATEGRGGREGDMAAAASSRAGVYASTSTRGVACVLPVETPAEVSGRLAALDAALGREATLGDGTMTGPGVSGSEGVTAAMLHARAAASGGKRSTSPSSPSALGSPRARIRVYDAPLASMLRFDWVTTEPGAYFCLSPREWERLPLARAAGLSTYLSSVAAGGRVDGGEAARFGQDASTASALAGLNLAASWGAGLWPGWPGGPTTGEPGEPWTDVADAVAYGPPQPYRMSLSALSSSIMEVVGVEEGRAARRGDRAQT